MTEDGATASVTHSSLDYLTKPDQHDMMSYMILISQRSTCLSLKQLEDSDGLCGFGQVGLHPAVASFLTRLWLTTLLVAVFKADSQLPHATAGEHVGDPLDHERTGLLRVG